jgi:predicted lipid-binding transport protein (Tim44 family)
MTKLLSMVLMLIGISFVAVDTEAASRVGGGRSVGTQRNTASQPAQKTPAQADQSAAAKTQPATPAPQPQSGMSKWLGPLAGLAIGAGLASLFMNNGMAGAIGGILMMLLLAGAVFFLIRWFMNRGKPQQQPLQYAGAGNTGTTERAPSQSAVPAQFSGNAAPGSLAATLGGSAGAMSAPSQSSQWPAGFDAPEFERQAKSNFVRLQAANDAGDASTLRDFVTPELFRELESEMKAAWGKPQKNEVIELNAEVIDVVTEQNLYIVSVRFSGRISENAAPAEAFNEIWHLEKPTTGRSGWLVSGIQQTN